MSPRPPLAFLVSLTLAAVLTACGGGATFGGGISGTGKPTVTVGTITATDTLTVAGTAFGTSMATVAIDGLAGDTGDLRVGMTATVLGLEDAGVIEAESIDVEEIVKGILQAKPDANTLVVFGQTVGVDADTLYGAGITPASSAGLVPGDQLKVYGYVLASGRALATRIERESSLESLRLAGIASNVNTQAETFSIGEQAVDYASADTSALPGGVPQNGQFLRVRGLGTLDALDQLVATKIERGELEEREDNEHTEIEGFVTSVLSPSAFVVGSVPVSVDAATSYVGGLAADVAVGVRVEVEGPFTDGTLAAHTVAFESDVYLESDVAGVVGDTITLVGFPGVTITVGALTEFNGEADSLGDIASGHHVEIRGRASGPSSVNAARIKRTGADDDIEIQGPVDTTPAPADPLLSILGVSIDTASISDSDFEGSGETVIGRSAFFATLVPGLLVRVSGTLSGGGPGWDEAAIEAPEGED